MEVQRTTTEGKSVISETLKLTYSIYTKGDKKEVVGEIRKDDDTVGRFNYSDNGILGFSISENSGMTADEIKQSFTQFVDDVSGMMK